MQKSIGIFYFSGTGNTEVIINLLGNELIRNGARVEFIRIDDVIKDHFYYDVNDFDIVGIGYPVHAFNAPKIVFDFIKQMPKTQDKYTFILKVAATDTLSGGATTMIKSKLKARGYDVFHESLFLFASKIFVKYPEDFIKQLYNAAKVKVKKMTEEIFTNKMRRQNNGVLLRAFTWIASKGVIIGDSIFGKDLKASKKCVQCNKCVKNCPVKNIRMEGFKIKFGWNCMRCYRCIYRCPQRAIIPGVFKYGLFEEHYNIQDIIDNPSLTGEYVTPNATGYCKRFKNYLFYDD